MSYKEKDTILYLDKVSVGYPDKNDHKKVNMILKDISLMEKDIVRDGHTATGRIIAIIGRSGRGKSTFFKALTGLLKPTSGKVLIPNFDGKHGMDAKEVEVGDVGLVNQGYTLFRHKTVNQIMHYAMRKDKRPLTEKNAVITAYLTEWDLIEHINKYPVEMSGGSRQRVAILEQLLTSKHFIVLDEPTSGLDPAAKEHVKDSIDKILSLDELNTIIMSTHDIEFSVRMADSIYIIGHPENDTVSTIIQHYDLKQMGLAWTEFNQNHMQLIKEIKDIVIKS